MSKEIIDSGLDISGFYHDYQKRNPLMRVTLHANTKPPVNKYKNWPSWNTEYKGGENEPLDTSFRYYADKALDKDEPTEPPKMVDDSSFMSDPRYGARSLCTSIVSEDFNIAIANTWGDFNGGQQFQDAFNSGYKMLEPYAYEGGNILKRLGEGLSTYESPDGSMLPTDWINNLGKKVDNIGSKLKSGGNILSRNLVVQGTRFRYYGGTGIAFSNLGMKLTLFADYIQVFNEDGTPREKDGIPEFVFQTPDDQLEPLLPYAIGTYKPLVDKDNDTEISDFISIGGEKFQKAIMDNKDIANKFLGWQMAPGGFKANIQYIDSYQPGTLMLKIGPYYRLKNLVIQDIQLNYSKHTAKYLDKETGNLKTCPLYCDVFITLTPANKYSDKMLKEFVMTRHNSYTEPTKSVREFEKKLNERLGLIRNWNV